MNRDSESFVRHARKNRRGQILYIVAVSLVVFLGFAGLAIDVGRLYMSYNELQSSTDAAALAGAQSLPNTTAASVATTFSGVSGNLNAQANLPNVTMASGYPQVYCSTTLTGLAAPCVAPATANAIVVRQQVAEPVTFLGLFGAGSLTLTATATAAMRGAARAPYNVALIMDTTGSMTGSKLTNALAGAVVLLAEVSPCRASAAICGSVTANSSGGGGNVANPIVTTATVANDLTCSGRNPPGPTTAAYTTPFPATSTYQIVNLSIDYRISDTAGDANATCNTSSGGICQTGDMPGASTTSGTYMSTKNECHQAITQAQAAAGTRVYTVAYGAANSGCSTDASPSISPCATLQQMATNDSTFFKDTSTACTAGDRPTTDLNTIFTQIAGDLTVARLMVNGTP